MSLVDTLLAVAVVLSVLFFTYCVALPEERFAVLEARYPALVFVLSVGMLGVMGVVAWTCGEVARGETSPLPWLAYSIEAAKHGIFDGIVAAFIAVVFLVWVLVLPAHIYANNRVRRGNRRPLAPYIVNALLGLIVCFQNNAIYRLVDWVGQRLW